MVKTFTDTSWNQQIPFDDGTFKSGIIIPQNAHNILEPIIQIFEEISEGEFRLIMDPGKVIIATSSTETILVSREPFNGKVIFK